MIGPFLRLQPPRTAEAVGRLRREIVTWARSTGMGEESIDDVALVVGELATNAVRHGSGPRMRVHVARLGDTADLRVEDDGPAPFPDPPTTPGEHGRGLAIVRALGGEVALDHGPNGTAAHVRLRIRPDTAPPAGTATLPGVPGP